MINKNFIRGTGQKFKSIRINGLETNLNTLRQAGLLISMSIRVEATNIVDFDCLK